jgi:hypothetical protein
LLRLACDKDVFGIVFRKNVEVRDAGAEGVDLRRTGVGICNGTAGGEDVADVDLAAAGWKMRLDVDLDRSIPGVIEEDPAAFLVGW